ncbi:hypothetical protein OAL10_03710 [Gammaproteobacteria bacterium]|nr:hypothetical protein [Gammaproteobacteria bacterium]
MRRLSYDITASVTVIDHRGGFALKQRTNRDSPGGRWRGLTVPAKIIENTFSPILHGHITSTAS